MDQKADAATSARAVYTFEDLLDWPAATAGLAHPLQLAVFGDPVAHSASPPMHDAALAALRLPMRYSRIRVRADELPAALGLIRAQGFLGVNLTIPHKAAALTLLDAIDPHAATLGAVNTVRVEPDGRLVGWNTDGSGFVRALAEDFAFSLRGKRVLLLGAAGGAGRALAAQCVLEGCARLTLVNRTFEKAEALAQELHAKFPERTAPQPGGMELEVIAWEQAAAPTVLAAIDLVVNASSVGLAADDVSPIPASALPSHLIVFDTVYRAAGPPTPLVAAAREAGARATGGLSLLLHQGALSFERWFNRPAPIEVMRRALRPDPS